MIHLFIALSVAGFMPQEEGASRTPDRLKELAWFIGTWTSEGEITGGEKYTDQHKVRWMKGRMFIRADYVMKVNGKVVHTAISIIGYDEAKDKIVVSIFASSGGIAHTEEVRTDKKDTWKFQGKASVHGFVVEERATQVKVSDDKFTILVEVKTDGRYQAGKTLEYTRKK